MTTSPSNTEKDPADWVTGNEPMTGAQRSYLKTLSEEAKQPFDEHLTKADASRRIEELQAVTGRGVQQDMAQDSRDDSAMQSLGRSVTESVTTSQPPTVEKQ